jgi:hypothetical protein
MARRNATVAPQLKNDKMQTKHNQKGKQRSFVTRQKRHDDVLPSKRKMKRTEPKMEDDLKFMIQRNLCNASYSTSKGAHDRTSNMKNFKTQQILRGDVVPQKHSMSKVISKGRIAPTSWYNENSAMTSHAMSMNDRVENGNTKNFSRHNGIFTPAP